jgi:hypothetical protein
MITNTKIIITSPKVNQVVFHKAFQGKDAGKKAYSVIINDGQYRDGTFSRLSNFWSWQKVSSTGRINKKVENGYGNFTIANGFKIRIVTETIVADKTTTLVTRHITVL